LLRKVLKIREDQASDDLETYATESCLELCAKLYSVLPRELRDKVYAYVYIDKSIYVNSDWGKRSYFTPDATDLDWDEIDPWSEAHYWKTEYVGNDILRETAEV
jgi:hypothetical protein